eukprot:scaffold7246_cov114-Isochrysis_galbana.AAC.1
MPQAHAAGRKSLAGYGHQQCGRPRCRFCWLRAQFGSRPRMRIRSTARRSPSQPAVLPARFVPLAARAIAATCLCSSAFRALCALRAGTYLLPDGQPHALARRATACNSPLLTVSSMGGQPLRSPKQIAGRFRVPVPALSRFAVCALFVLCTLPASQ